MAEIRKKPKILRTGKATKFDLEEFSGKLAIFAITSGGSLRQVGILRGGMNLPEDLIKKFSKPGHYVIFCKNHKSRSALICQQ